VPRAMGAASVCGKAPLKAYIPVTVRGRGGRPPLPPGLRRAPPLVWLLAPASLDLSPPLRLLASSHQAACLPWGRPSCVFASLSLPALDLCARPGIPPARTLCITPSRLSALLRGPPFPTHHQLPMDLLPQYPERLLVSPAPPCQTPRLASLPQAARQRAPSLLTPPPPRAPRPSPSHACPPRRPPPRAAPPSLARPPPAALGAPRPGRGGAGRPCAAAARHWGLPGRGRARGGWGGGGGLEAGGRWLPASLGGAANTC
jgi:hypothetical protein